MKRKTNEQILDMLDQAVKLRKTYVDEITIVLKSKKRTIVEKCSIMSMRNPMLSHLDGEIFAYMNVLGIDAEEYYEEKE